MFKMKVLLAVATILVYFLLGEQTNAQSITICPPTLDVVFIVDSSGSIGSDADQNWGIILAFMTQITDRLQIGPSGVKVAVVTFSDDAVKHWGLDSSITNTRETLKQKILQLPYLGKSTYTDEGLTAALDIFKESDRPDVENLAILVTDGKSSKRTYLLQDSATKLKDVTRVMAVGIADIDMGELKLIASSECDIFTVEEFYIIAHNLGTVMDLICSCPPGYVVDECNCNQCPMGTYQPTWNVLECRDCSRGLITLVSASSVCLVPCKAGTKHFNSTSDECVPCPRDTYQPNAGEQDCVMCSNGFRTFTEGNIDQSSCQAPCPPGSRHSIAKNGDCVPCSKGTYQPNEGQDMCIDCPGNFTTAREGSMDASKCAAAPRIEPAIGPPDESKKKGLGGGLLAAVIVIVLLFLLVLLVLLVLGYRRWVKRKAEQGSGTTWLDGALRDRAAGGGGATGGFFAGLFGKKKSDDEKVVVAESGDHTYVETESKGEPLDQKEDVYENPDVFVKRNGPKTKPKPSQAKPTTPSPVVTCGSLSLGPQDPLYENQAGLKTRKPPPPLPLPEEPIYDNEAYDQEYENVAGLAAYRRA